MVRSVYYKVINSFFWALTLCVVTSCGSNVYSGIESSDPAQDALLALEQDNPNKAIQILEAAMASDPDNNEFKTILASALAHSAGVDPLNFALSVLMGGGDAQEDSESGNQLTSMFGSLPDANQLNINAMSRAVTLIEGIPVANRNSADLFKLSIFHTVRMGLVTKQFSDSVEGDFSPENLQNLTEEQAIAILESLIGASSAMSAIATLGEEADADTSPQLDAIQEAIASQPGDSDVEKLRNYLAAN